MGFGRRRNARARGFPRVPRRLLYGADGSLCRLARVLHPAPAGQVRAPQGLPHDGRGRITLSPPPPLQTHNALHHASWRIPHRANRFRRTYTQGAQVGRRVAFLNHHTDGLS